jgi:hypothetical protein
LYALRRAATVGHDADLRPRLGQDKYFLDVSRDYISRWKVDFAYHPLPGFEEREIEASVDDK